MESLKKPYVDAILADRDHGVRTVPISTCARPPFCDPDPDRSADRDPATPVRGIAGDEILLEFFLSGCCRTPTRKRSMMAGSAHAAATFEELHAASYDAMLTVLPFSRPKPVQGKLTVFRSHGGALFAYGFCPEADALGPSATRSLEARGAREPHSARWRRMDHVGLVD